MGTFFRLIFVCICLYAIPAGQGMAAEVEVFVSILPQKYFVERIGGPLVKASVLVGPGQSPATYEPTPRQIAALGRAHLYFRIGVPFEDGFIKNISYTYPGLKIIDTRKGVPLLYFKDKAQENKHGENHAHAGAGDPHIWLDPKRVKIQAATICDALTAADPSNSVRYSNNLDAFRSDLDRIDASITAILKPLKGRTIYVFHPAFGYFADSYGLKQIAVERSGKEPGPKRLTALIDSAERERIEAIFVQPQFSKRHAEAIARETGSAVTAIDPLPQDYMKGLEEIARSIRMAIGPPLKEGRP